MRVLGLVAFVACLAGGPAMAQDINFGDDSGEWANDGECDDPRFIGPGMTETVLLSSDVLRDASDCRTFFNAGQLTLRGVAADGTIDFGDDSSEWARDGECDDMRFAGPGMTLTPLLFEDVMTDATDCRNAFDAGLLTLAGQ
ncbi:MULTISPECIES: hypothetical protein [unclassified Yoonia]|uniref:hypothetical protein n=1 Tax=unclassified Yoonia TaxID=2629118 RepID=UPI002AFEFA49|nr:MULTISPECIES: hypothetical protein [unclassified Yoonia]